MKNKKENNIIIHEDRIMDYLSNCFICNKCIL